MNGSRVPALELLRVNVIVRRAQAQLSQSELAVLAGISRPTISRIERAAGDIGLAVVQRLADALGTTVAELFASPDTHPVDKVELARRAGVATSDRIDARTLLAAIDEAAEEPRALRRYSRAGRPPLSR